MEIKDLIVIEYKSDERMALDFDGYQKIETSEFVELLRPVSMEIVYNRVEESDECYALRFFFIYEQCLKLIAETNELEYINSFLYFNKENQDGK